MVCSWKRVKGENMVSTTNVKANATIVYTYLEIKGDFLERNLRKIMNCLVIFIWMIPMTAPESPSKM